MTRTAASISTLVLVLLLGCEDGSTSSERKGFSVSLPSPSVRIAPGGEASFKAWISPRGGFIDDVSVSLNGTAPEGITVEGGTARIEGTGGAVDVKVRVTDSVVPGVYDLALRATADDLSDKIGLALVVTREATFGVELTESKLPAYPGATARIGVRLIPLNGFRGTLEVTPLQAPEGVTVGSASVELDSDVAVFERIELEVKADVAPGALPVALQVSSGDDAQEVSFTLDVGTHPFDLVPQSPALVVNPGRPGALLVNLLWRGSFNEDVTVSLSGLPQGMRATPVTVPYVSGRTQATFVLALEVGPDVAMGGASVQITGASKTAASGAALTIDVKPFAGQRDEGFGQSGQAFASFGAGEVEVSALAVGANDRVVVGGVRKLGDGTHELLLARFLADGAPDSAFASSGRFIQPSAEPIWVEAMAFDSMGRLLVAGQRTVSGNAQAMVLRLTGKGAPDASFGTDGYVLVDLGDVDTTTDILIEESGRLVFSATRQAAGSSKSYLFRLESDGTIDPTFGTDGIAEVRDGVAQKVALHPAGGYLIAGAEIVGARRLYLARTTALGALDKSFATDGVLLSDFGGSGPNAAIALEVTGDEESGRILLGSRTALARFQLQGAPDDTFGTNGVVSFTDFSAQAIALDAAGRLVVAGSRPEKVGMFSMQRLLTNGTVDQNFGDFGMNDQPVADGGVAKRIALQSSGKIVVAGTVTFKLTETRGFGVVRLWP